MKNLNWLAVFAALFALIATTVLFTGRTFAAKPAKPVYQVTSKVFLDGKHATDFQMILEPNKPAEISSLSENPAAAIKLNVTVLEKDENGKALKDAVHLKIKIQYKYEGRTIEAYPIIIAKLGQQAEISETGLGPDDNINKDSYKLQVTAVKK